MIMHEGAKAYSIGRTAYVDLCTVLYRRYTGNSRVLSTTLVVIPFITSRVLLPITFGHQEQHVYL